MKRSLRWERKTAPAYQSKAASAPGVASATVANGNEAKPRAAAKVNPARPSAMNQSGKASTTTSAVAMGMARRPGKSASAFAATETIETR